MSYDSIHLDFTRLQNSIDFVSCACNFEHITQNHPQWISPYPRVRAWVNPHHKLPLFPLNGPERGRKLSIYSSDATFLAHYLLSSSFFPSFTSVFEAEGVSALVPLCNLLHL